MLDAEQIKLCNDDTCTSCAACANVCSKDAIEMVPDERGFPRPRIDALKCVGCHCCERACPVLNPSQPKAYTKPRAFAVWHPDDKVRWFSSSGGAFSCLAEVVLRRGGVVFGAAWNNDLLPELIAIEAESGLELLRESKYVQSIVGNSLSRVKKYLDSGREVLFSGAPCQVAALYAVLGNKNYDKLITVDFICHAMPSPAVFKKYIKALEEKYKAKITKFRFRDKSIGVECNLLAKVTLNTGAECNLFFDDNAFANAFINNIISKTACASCRFNYIPRQADFSLADFRGLGEQIVFPWEADKVRGFTGVLVNSERAKCFMQEGLKCETWVERPLEELVGSQPHLYSPALDSKLSSLFWRDFHSSDWNYLLAKYLKPSKKYRRYIWMRRVLGPWLFLRIGLVEKTLKKTRTTGIFLPKKPMFG